MLCLLKMLGGSLFLGPLILEGLRMKENYACSKKFDQTMMTTFALYFICYIMVILTKSRPEENFVTGLMFMSVLLFILGIWVNSVMALIYGLKMVFEPNGWHCKPAWQLSIDLLFITIGVATLLLVLGLTVFYTSKAYLKKRREAKARKELETLFESIYDPNKDVEKLIVKYQELLEEMELTEPEKMIFSDAFCQFWEKDQTNVEESQTSNCIICYGAFQVDDKYLQYPGCKHEYHFDCLTVWLEKTPRCPMCKSHARIAMIRALHDKSKN